MNIRSIFSKFGPGIITGASDDDPSGIATYSQAGAMFGLATLWTAIIAFPLMAVIQQMCARIGFVTGYGLAGTIKNHYPRWVLYFTILFSAPAIIMNIGANIAGMGAVGTMLFPEIDSLYFSVVFTVLLLILVIYFPYQKISNVLKYLCIALLVYCFVPFFYDNLLFSDIAYSTFIPTIMFSKEYFAVIVGILGTTISPYLFFWQASVEVEERNQRPSLIVDKKSVSNIDQDVDSGMLFSGIIMYFIILTTGTVLFQHGIHTITTVDEAALALQPLLGKSATLLFAIGIIATGLIAIPVLSGALSYMLSESIGFTSGLDNHFKEAKGFYSIIALSLIVGLSLNYIGITPINALIYTAIFYGITAPVLIGVILHIANNKDIMGDYVNTRLMNIGGFIALFIMSLAALSLIYFSFTG